MSTHANSDGFLYMCVCVCVYSYLRELYVCHKRTEGHVTYMHRTAGMWLGWRSRTAIRSVSEKIRLRGARRLHLDMI